MTPSPCCSRAELERLLDERLDPTELLRISDHVAACAGCQTALETLTADSDASHPSWRGLAAGDSPLAPPDFLDRMKQAAPAAEPPSDAAVVLDEGSYEIETWPAPDDYEILGVLGRGGEGVVYRAWHRPLARIVALKVLRDADQARPEAILRFRLEAETLARLLHPNIVQVYEVGNAGGRPFFAMEYVEGGPLSARLRGQPQPARESAMLVEALARAVHAAHEAGVVHRDLKPSNVLLAKGPAGDGFGAPKISDFGLAKRVQVDTSLTATGQVLGTPGYMAPEQAQGEALGPAADVYALGSVLYHLLTGRPPFVGGRPMDVLLQVVHDEPVSLRRLFPQTPRDLETICLKCLQKEPRRRYATAAALADDLRRYVDGRPVHARPLSRIERTWRWCRRNPGPASLLVAVVLATTLGLWRLPILSQSMVHASALEGAAQEAAMLDDLNDFYTNSVVEPAKAHGVRVAVDYRTQDRAIPPPATLGIELGDYISGRSPGGPGVRLYSDYPFPNRTDGGPRDDFERQALAALRDAPDRPYYRFEDAGGRPVLRYAAARVMKESCVDCHNTRADSPKKDWKVGDVRGVLEIVRPLDKDEALTRDSLRGALAWFGGLSVALLAASGLVLVFSNRRRGATRG